MNRVDRLTGILLLLQEKPRTSDEIARHFEVSKRTVLRDVQALCEIGVPVIAREGSGGGYSLPPAYRLSPLPLTTHEAFLLLLALRTLAPLGDSAFGQDRATLAAKLQVLLPPQQLARVAPLLATVREENPAQVPDLPFLQPLLAAAEEGRWVEVAYQSAERLSTQRLLPRELSMQRGYWYCRAYAAEHGEERTYRVDRIRALTPIVAPLAPPGAAPPYADESHPQIVAILTAAGVAAVESEPHLGRQIEHQSDGTGRLTFHCPPGELAWYARYFASLGPDVQVEAPAELRARLRQIGQKLVEQYPER